MDINEALWILGPIRAVKRGDDFWLYGSKCTTDKYGERKVVEEDVIEAAMQSERKRNGIE